jgi:hypothetical protein
VISRWSDAACPSLSAGVPSLLHEALIWLFVQRPALLEDLLRHAKLLEADEHLRRAPGDLPQIVAPARQVDAVFVEDRESPRVAIVVEVLRTKDRDKLRTLPVYQAGVRAEHDCPTEAVVIAPDDDVADWAERDIELDRSGSRTRVHVLRRRDLPKLVDPTEARENPERAALAALAHAPHVPPDEAARLLGTAWEAAQHVHPSRATILLDAAVAAFPVHLMNEIRSTMRRIDYTAPFEESGIRELLEEHLREKIIEEARQAAEREAKLREAQEKMLQAQEHVDAAMRMARFAIVTSLRSRGLELGAEQRVRLDGTDDIITLERLLTRAPTCATVDDLFDR